MGRIAVVPWMVALLLVPGAVRGQRVADAGTGELPASGQVITVDNPPNSEAEQRKPYVVLVSLDGFRWDYPKTIGAPHLQAMAKSGVSVPDGMLPSFPSLTFPNHYTIVTGLYPEHHGIIGNSFYDPAKKAVYSYTRTETNSDGSWYGGVPLWSLAESQGMRTACLFWPGSEAKIAGWRPSYYLHFNDGLDDHARIAQVVQWLGLPAAERPHLITLYYSNVDHAGHAHGPDSPEVREAVGHVDELLGELRERLKGTGLPIDLVVVSDHGMVTLQPPAVVLSEFANLGETRTVGSLLYPETEAEKARIYAEFKAHPSPKFNVYRTAEVPKELHFNSNPREGDPLVIPTGPYTLQARENKLPQPTQLHGSHGFDPHAMPEMKAIFYAEGPDFARGKTLKTFENVDVFPMLVQILGLRPPAEVDGRLKPVAKALTKAARKRKAS